MRPESVNAFYIVHIAQIIIAQKYTFTNTMTDANMSYKLVCILNFVSVRYHCQIMTRKNPTNIERVCG